MAQKDIAQQTGPKFDGLKWLVVLLLIVAGIVANYFYGHVAWAIRAAIGIVMAVVILLIAAQTGKGQRAWGFFKGARTELRKVVWPGRSETVQTTFIVIAMVVVTALILWGVDAFFMWAMAWLTGQRG